MAASTDEIVLDPSELQHQLEEKDQLVHALTERLEEAAEQLDRVQRSGADKGARVTGGGGGFSADVIAQQQTLIEQLGKSVDLWDDVQPRDAFARIESRLDELRGLLEGRNVGKPSVTAPAAQATPPRSPAPSRKADPPGRTVEKRQDKSTNDEPLSAWEQMKAELMGADAASTPAPSKEVVAVPAEQSVTAPAPPPPLQPPQAVVCDDTAQESLNDLELPVPINVDIADRTDLAAGIEVRDQYISYLTRRLRSAENRTHQPIDWEYLNNAPEELRETLQQLEADLVDRLRIAEVDLSLERARLSRVETRVRGMQKQIEKRLQSVAGKGPVPNAESAAEPNNEKRSKSWFGSRGR